MEINSHIVEYVNYSSYKRCNAIHNRGKLVENKRASSGKFCAIQRCLKNQTLKKHFNVLLNDIPINLIYGYEI